MVACKLMRKIFAELSNVKSKQGKAPRPRFNDVSLIGNFLVAPPYLIAFASALSGPLPAFRPGRCAISD